MEGGQLDTKNVLVVLALLGCGVREGLLGRDDGLAESNVDNLGLWGHFLFEERREKI